MGLKLTNDLDYWFHKREGEGEDIPPFGFHFNTNLLQLLLREVGGLANVWIWNGVKLAQEGSNTNKAAPSSLFYFMRTMTATSSLSVIVQTDLIHKEIFP